MEAIPFPDDPILSQFQAQQYFNYQQADQMGYHLEKILMLEPFPYVILFRNATYDLYRIRAKQLSFVRVIEEISFVQDQRDKAVVYESLVMPWIKEVGIIVFKTNEGFKVFELKLETGELSVILSIERFDVIPYILIPFPLQSTRMRSFGYLNRYKNHIQLFTQTEITKAATYSCELVLPGITSDWKIHFLRRIPNPDPRSKLFYVSFMGSNRFSNMLEYVAKMCIRQEKILLKLIRTSIVQCNTPNKRFLQIDVNTSMSIYSSPKYNLFTHKAEILSRKARYSQLMLDNKKQYYKPLKTLKEKVFAWVHPKYKFINGFLIMYLQDNGESIVAMNLENMECLDYLEYLKAYGKQ
ncbi:hypothetical protein FGO68_gene17296 [Halteria grandinella]|uniref:Uncharacterized protein n=1 Tax=Halteria grandinella TaxID=5974 RepID=A0A8J8T0L6_HALGN|nr:hypothetical protein FGO68_gene17296 [Halteria grandinella]